MCFPATLQTGIAIVCTPTAQHDTSFSTLAEAESSLALYLTFRLVMYWAVQAGLLTPLIFDLHRLSPLAALNFRCVLSSQWKAVPVNLRILHCQL